MFLSVENNFDHNYTLVKSSKSLYSQFFLTPCICCLILVIHHLYIHSLIWRFDGPSKIEANFKIIKIKVCVVNGPKSILIRYRLIRKKWNLMECRYVLTYFNKNWTQSIYYSFLQACCWAKNHMRKLIKPCASLLLSRAKSYQ